MSDSEILNTARDGDETAFATLYRSYRDLIFRFGYRLTGSREAAEDILHDCFLSLMQAPDRFVEANGSLRAYLLGAARNLALKRLRNDRREQELPPEQMSEEDEPFAQASLREDGFLVRQAVQSLPPMQREALILFEYEDLSLQEVARIVEADVGTVKGRLHRARESLRRSLTPVLRTRRKRSEANHGTTT